MILGEDVRADQAQFVDLLAVPQQPEEAEREQPAVDRLDSRVIVEQPERGGDRLAVDFGDGRQFRHDQMFHFAAHEFQFLVRQWRETPGADERLVVDVQERADFLGEAAFIEPPEGDIEAADHFAHDEIELFVERVEHADFAPEGVQVLAFVEPALLDQPRVVRRVVGHHERGWTVEAVD